MILNVLSEIDDLATNQGVVGSNPAGRANSALNSMACKQLLQAIFLCCAIEQNFRIEWDNVRADRLGSKGFALLSVDLQCMVAIRASELNSLDDGIAREIEFDKIHGDWLRNRIVLGAPPSLIVATVLVSP